MERIAFLLKKSLRLRVRRKYGGPHYVESTDCRAKVIAFTFFVPNIIIILFVEQWKTKCVIKIQLTVIYRETKTKQTVALCKILQSWFAAILGCRIHTVYT